MRTDAEVVRVRCFGCSRGFLFIFVDRAKKATLFHAVSRQVGGFIFPIEDTCFVIESCVEGYVVVYQRPKKWPESTGSLAPHELGRMPCNKLESLLLYVSV